MLQYPIQSRRFWAVIAPVAAPGQVAQVRRFTRALAGSRPNPLRMKLRASLHFFLDSGPCVV